MTGSYFSLDASHRLYLNERNKKKQKYKYLVVELMGCDAFVNGGDFIQKCYNRVI